MRIIKLNRCKGGDKEFNCFSVFEKLGETKTGRIKFRITWQGINGNTFDSITECVEEKTLSREQYLKEKRDFLRHGETILYDL